MVEGEKNSKQLSDKELYPTKKKELTRDDRIYMIGLIKGFNAGSYISAGYSAPNRKEMVDIVNSILTNADQPEMNSEELLMMLEDGETFGVMLRGVARNLMAGKGDFANDVAFRQKFLSKPEGWNE